LCGIAGNVAVRGGLPPPALEDLKAMAGALRHRGPDEAGVYRARLAGLAHTRLSIIDLATGQQPMSNGSGTLWITFNGEIFNYIELRATLRDLGHQFRTQSDTEVVLHAYEEWGEGAFERFNGQFAIALWDESRETLVLARDRLGVRPLYLCEHGGRLWFASEVKALFAGDRSIPRQLDPVGLAETFTFWSTVPPQTVYEGITELEPGHLRIVTPSSSTDVAFWSPQYPVDAASAFRGPLDEAVEQTRAALESAVALRMLRSDVQVGCYLSGGLDSSLIAALARRATGHGFLTFSIRFDDPEYDETRFQRAMAERLESEHHELLVTRRDIADAFPAVVAHAERPMLRTAPAPLYLLSQAVRGADVKVVLTGEGGDEMFAGYDLFREAKVRRFWGRAPESELRPLLLERLYPYLRRSPVTRRTMAREYFGRDREHWAEPGFSHRPRWRSASALFRVFAPDVRQVAERANVGQRLLESRPPEFDRWSALSQDQYLEVRTLLTGYLLASQGDRMLMAHSVEGRFPFLDTEVTRLANALPPTYKLRGLNEKYILKRVARGLIPDEIIARPKQPYRSPDAAAFTADPVPDWVGEVTGRRQLVDAGMFDPAAVERLWRKCRAATSPSNADNMALVGVLSTGLLHETLRAAPQPVPAIEFATVVDRAALSSARPGVAEGESR
jgi:asparagine synthase (glutamine-hydrolysing)